VGGARPEGDGPYDVAKILEADPGALSKPDSPLWGPIGMYHYWGEPLFGYYLGMDPWVLWRHARLLGDAGVDTLIFDTTNALTYPEVYLRLCEVFEKVREAGGGTPGIAFMVNTEAGATARKLYAELYRSGRHSELWFRWEGKPLLICDPAEADEELREFFTLRRAHWPFTMTNTAYAWHWEATYPQPYGFTADPGRPEQVNVSVAQNLRASDGQVTNMSSGEARGRGFHDGRQDGSEEALFHGRNAEEQWRRVFELDPPFVMVTGWNEWVAGRWGSPGGPLVFVDQLNREYSRDIEPMLGGHGDHYYAQLVTNVRRYKGTAALPVARAGLEGLGTDGWPDWELVVGDYGDERGDTLHRDFGGAGGTHYRNNTGRNDLLRCQVAHDAEHLWFRVETAASLTSRSGTNWMWLFLDIDGDSGTGWEGYEFLLNRVSEGEGFARLERHVQGWEWERVGAVASRVGDRELVLMIPRAALGMERGGFSLDFKWADHLQRPGEVMDFYLSGDVAPEGRFRFRYRGLP